LPNCRAVATAPPVGVTANLCMLRSVSFLLDVVVVPLAKTEKARFR
jgi:hypothetical protein